MTFRISRTMPSDRSPRARSASTPGSKPCGRKPYGRSPCGRRSCGLRPRGRRPSILGATLLSCFDPFGTVLISSTIQPPPWLCVSPFHESSVNLLLLHVFSLVQFWLFIIFLPLNPHGFRHRASAEHITLKPRFTNAAAGQGLV